MKSWMREDSQENVATMLDAGRRAEEIKQNKVRYKLIADLMAGKEIDLTLDKAMFAAVNRERLTLEQYLGFFPQECKDAMEAAQERRSADESDTNRQSMAKWRQLGFMPSSVQRLFVEVYPNKSDRSKAIRRFFNEFPKFRISRSKV